MMAGTPTKSTDCEDPEIALSAEEALAARTGIGMTLVGLTNRPVDQVEIGYRGVLLHDLRVDE